MRAQETASGGMDFEAHPMEGVVMLGEGGVGDFGSGVHKEADVIPDLRQSREVINERLDDEKRRAINAKIGDFLMRHSVEAEGM